MKELPRLELTEDPNKNNNFIIFRHGSKGKKVSSVTKNVKRRPIKKRSTKKRRSSKSRKGFFNIF